MSDTIGLEGADLLAGTIGAVVGGVIAFVGHWAKSYVDYLKKTKRDLTTAALSCEDRLQKILDARAGRSPKEVDDLPEENGQRKRVKDEEYFLGRDCDRYLRVIGAARAKDRRRHFPIYQQLRPGTVQHLHERDLRKLIAALHSMTMKASTEI